MLKLTFKQTSAEVMVRAASTIIFNTLNKLHYPSVALSELAENPQYGFTASASIEEVGAKFVRITDLKDGGINWDTVPYCKCDEPEKYLIYPNDILFARTGATTGKTHLVKEAPYAVFASYLIRIRPKPLVEPEYLYSFFQSDAYWTQILDEKEGSAQPNVNGQKLMKILVPMVDSEIQSAISNFLEVVRKRQDGSFKELPELPPPLEQQRRIMMRVEELVGKVEEVRSLRQKALIETEALLAASSTKFLNNTLTNGQLSDILLNKPRNGWSARCNNMPQGIPVLSLGPITGFLYRETEFKRTSEPVLLDAHYWLKPGDLLITRSNTPELVGHAAIYNGFPYPCIYPDLMMHLEIDESKTDKHFVHHWLASTLVRDYIKSRAKGTSPTMKKISQEVVMNIPFPSDLSVCEQYRIVSHLDELRTKVYAIRQLREQAMKELDALLPSILDKAFKGEL